MDGRTPLHFACENGRVEVVKYLVENLKFDVGKQNKLMILQIELIIHQCITTVSPNYYRISLNRSLGLYFFPEVFQ